jgi:hypothetical protein
LKDFAAILSKLSGFGKQSFKGHHPGAERFSAIGDRSEQMDSDGCLSFTFSRSVFRAPVLLKGGVAVGIENPFVYFP